MKTLVVLLPGLKYTLDAPLMYYGEGICHELGLEVLAYSYGALGSDEGEGDFLSRHAQHLVVELEERIISGGFLQVIFYGKSIGTSLAAKAISLLETMGITERVKMRCIFLTPLANAKAVAHKYGGLMVVGTQDEFFKKEDIVEVIDYELVELHLVQQAGHSLLGANYRESLKHLQTVMDLVYKHLSVFK